MNLWFYSSGWFGVLAIKNPTFKLGFLSIGGAGGMLVSYSLKVVSKYNIDAAFASFSRLEDLPCGIISCTTL